MYVSNPSPEQEVSAAIEGFLDKVSEVNGLSERIEGASPNAVSTQGLELLEHSIECLKSSLDGSSFSTQHSNTELSLESRFSQIKQQISDIAIRIYEAIIKGLKWLYDAFAGEQAKIRYKRQYVESTLESTEALINEIRNSLKKPKRANFKHTRINQHLSMGGSVHPSSLLMGLSNMRVITKEVMRYSKAQRANLTKVITLHERSRVTINDFVIEARPASVNNELPETETNFRGIKRYFKAYKTREMPGNTALLYKSYKPNTTVGLVRGSQINEPAPPYMGGAQGLSLTQYTPQITVNSNVTRLVPVASIKELIEYYNVCKELLRSYLYLESDFENLAQDFKRQVSKFESLSPEEKTARELGYLRDYVIGIQSEITSLLTGYSKYLLETIFQALVYVRHCGSQYK